MHNWAAVRLRNGVAPPGVAAVFLDVSAAAVHPTVLRYGSRPPRNRVGDHDVKVGTKVAEIITGGNISPGTPISEQYLLDLEREGFKSLCGEKKTQERIQFTLKTGKPLRN